MASMAFDQNDAGGSHVQSQSQHGGKQQHRGKGREIQWFAGADGDHDDHQADNNIESKQKVQQKRRQRQHQHGHDQQHQYGYTQTGEVKLCKVLSNR